jgi:hypothetical protein
MKKFAFPLERVMDWRGAQARIEELKLEILFGELHGIDARIAAVLDARAVSDEILLTASSATGFELARIDAFGRFSVAERARLNKLRADCVKRVDGQIQVVVAKRRDVRLLERLREQRLAVWQTGFSREIDAQAEESHLAMWNARR